MILVGVIACPISHINRHKEPSRPHIITKQELLDYTRGLYNGDEIQYSCLVTLWTMESHWNAQAKGFKTKQGQAIGIAQALPADKMAIMGADYLTNPYTQIKWGLKYIKVRYNNRACIALKWELNKGWY